MRIQSPYTSNPALLVKCSTLFLLLSQACANGDAKQSNNKASDVGGAAATGGSLNGSTDIGGTLGQGGGVAVTGTGGSNTTDTSQGGAPNNSGGSPNGGDTGNEGGQPVSTGGSSGESQGGAPSAGGASATGGANTGGMATGGSPWSNCKTSLDCVAAPNNLTICDPGSGSCVQCVKPADCGPSFDCTSNKCVHYDACTTSPDCPTGKACDTTQGRCVECVVDGDCASGKCSSQKCRISCTSDNACTPSSMLCNATLGFCVQCNSMLKCASGLVCDPTGNCIPPICKSGDRICSEGGIATCLPDGSAFGDPAFCPDNSSCKASSGMIACFEDADGGTGCAIGGAPCKQIPKFTGTQVVDAQVDDLCALPAVIFDAAHSKPISYHTTPTEVATVRAGWSAAGFHVFVDVVDSSVQVVSTVDMTQATTKTYQGDSIELMISSSNSVTGLTSTDANTLHVTVPAQGPAVIVKTANSNGSSQGAYTAMPTSAYHQRLTATGYAIEMKLPWPGAAPAAGATVRFDIILNSADKSFGNVDDMRDGQLIYYLGAVSNSTCQGSDLAPFCDDRAWCSTQLTQ